MGAPATNGLDYRASFVNWLNGPSRDLHKGMGEQFPRGNHLPPADETLAPQPTVSEKYFSNPERLTAYEIDTAYATLRNKLHFMQVLYNILHNTPPPGSLTGFV